MTADPSPIFVDLSADSSENGPTCIESMCPRCEENGTTMLLFTRIPHFREVVVMAFECPHCHERNNELQGASIIQDRGSRYELAVRQGDLAALSRQVIKSDSATVSVPELELEIPPGTQRGSLSTVEGVLAKAAEGLRALQDERREAAPELAAQLDGFLERLAACQRGEAAFRMIVDDPAGNSFIECVAAGPSADPQLSISTYARTEEQSAALGLATADELTAARGGPGGGTGLPTLGVVPEEFRGRPEAQHHGHKAVGAAGARAAMASLGGASAVAALTKYAAPEEVMVFPGTCMACNLDVEVRMITTDIPFFKQIVVMSSSCDGCGYRNAEIKPGGAISARGRQISCQVNGMSDLLRDVIKSDSATVLVPELELELSAGTLGGMVTTIEGVLRQVEAALRRLHSVGMGDAAPAPNRQGWTDFFGKLDVMARGDVAWTLVLRDPLANSFISTPQADPLKDGQMIVEEFDRSFEENEELGLNDIDVTAGVTYAEGAGPDGGAAAAAGAGRASS